MTSDSPEKRGKRRKFKPPLKWEASRSDGEVLFLQKKEKKEKNITKHKKILFGFNIHGNAV